MPFGFVALVMNEDRFFFFFLVVSVCGLLPGFFRIFEDFFEWLCRLLRGGGISVFASFLFKGG